MTIIQSREAWRFSADSYDPRTRPRTRAAVLQQISGTSEPRGVIRAAAPTPLDFANNSFATFSPSSGLGLFLAPRIFRHSYGPLLCGKLFYVGLQSLSKVHLSKQSILLQQAFDYYLFASLSPPLPGFLDLPTALSSIVSSMQTGSGLHSLSKVHLLCM